MTKTQSNEMREFSESFRFRYTPSLDMFDVVFYLWRRRHQMSLENFKEYIRNLPDDPGREIRRVFKDVNWEEVKDKARKIHQDRIIAKKRR